MLKFFIFILFLLGKEVLFAQINSAQDARQMFASTSKEDSTLVRSALEIWQKNQSFDYTPYLFLSDYHIIQNLILLQDLKNIFEEEHELIFEKRSALVKDYLQSALALAPQSLDIKLAQLYAAYLIHSEADYKNILMEIVQFNRDTDFAWKVDNPYAIPIDYHTILDELKFENTSEHKFLYWFYIWGQNNLKVMPFIPFERTKSLIDFTSELFLKEYPNSLHVHLLIFHLYKDLEKDDIALGFLSKALDLNSEDMMLKIIFAVEAYNTTMPYETAFPFRMRAIDELNMVLEKSDKLEMKNRAVELKNMIALEKE